MTDDPWRKPDPNVPPPPPGYGPPPGYAPPPGYGTAPAYGPRPGPGFNPYQAPLPKRGGFTRLLWILCTVGLLVLGGCGVGIYYLAHTLSRNADAANSFLRDVRDQRFEAAYGRLCPAQRAAEPSTVFVSALQAAVARNHRVTSFDIVSVNTTPSNGVTERTAGASVRFGDGDNLTSTFRLEKSGSKICISSGYQLLS